jgi:hypothetical protein
LSIVYSNNEKIIQKTNITTSFDEADDLKKIKEFLLNQIKSPFTNINYKIKIYDAFIPY